jgi:hypothetical protein
MARLVLGGGQLDELGLPLDHLGLQAAVRRRRIRQESVVVVVVVEFSGRTTKRDEMGGTETIFLGDARRRGPRRLRARHTTRAKSSAE